MCFSKYRFAILTCGALLLCHAALAQDAQPHPDGSADSQVRFQLNFLFPAG